MRSLSVLFAAIATVLMILIPTYSGASTDKIMRKHRNLKEHRISGPFLDALQVWLDNGNVPLTGADLCRVTGHVSGTIYPLIHRMEDKGWLKSRNEAGDPSQLGRPLRKFYILTTDGFQKAQILLAKYGRGSALSNLQPSNESLA